MAVAPDRRATLPRAATRGRRAERGSGPGGGRQSGKPAPTSDDASSPTSYIPVPASYSSERSAWMYLPPRIHDATTAMSVSTAAKSKASRSPFWNDDEIS